MGLKLKHVSKRGPMYIEVQVTWKFPSKSQFLSTLQVTWESSHLGEIPSDFGCWLGISWVALKSLFVYLIFWNSPMWHFTVCFTIHSQKAVCSLFIDQLCVQCHWLWQHHQLKLIHGLLWCCIQWCHSSVDNSPSPWWHHQIDTFSALLAICAGNSQSLVNSLHKGQWCGALMFSLIYVWINGWVNNGEAGDLRCHRAHYSVLPKVFWAPVLRTSGSWNLPIRIEGSLIRNFNMYCWYMFLMDVTTDLTHVTILI